MPHPTPLSSPGRSTGVLARRVSPILLGLTAAAIAVLLVPTAVPYGTSPTGSSPTSTLSAAASAPARAATPSVTNNSSSWTNITNSTGNAPSDRSLSQAAFSPALNATILFGGYNGAGGNFALGDTWQFSDNQWTELFPAVSPAPRWGATMVYDPELQALVLFGGRNADTFFNDTWLYNATGWHSISTTTAPSPRYDYGIAYDPALGQVVLYGGGIGNNPAGTFTNFVFYDDTWTFQNGVWTNITSAVGTGPSGRLLRGQMAYDARDGYVLVTGGYYYVPLGTETPCGYIVFNAAWGATWTFNGTGWVQAVSAQDSPPTGDGVLWFDPQANETLYYEGMWLGPADRCDVGGDVVWSYAGGNWTLVTEGNVSAPAPRQQTVFVDDLADNEQLMFGGELGATSSEYYAAYLNDTWTYQPTWVTFDQHAVPAGDHWQVRLQKVDAKSSAGKPILFVEGPGHYAYTAYLVRNGMVLAGTGGTVALAHAPKTVALSYGTLPAHVVRVTFRERGLSDGSLWSVAVAGQSPVYTTARSIALGEPAGSYTYTVSAESPRYTGAGGSFVVGSRALARTVQFTLVTYALEFSEHGLRTGARWCVALSPGKSHCSTASTIAVAAANGTYDYRASSPRSGFAAQDGSVRVQGAATTVSITFGDGDAAVPANGAAVAVVRRS